MVGVGTKAHQQAAIKHASARSKGMLLIWPDIILAQCLTCHMSTSSWRDLLSSSVQSYLGLHAPPGVHNLVTHPDSPEPNIRLSMSMAVGVTSES